MLTYGITFLAKEAEDSADTAGAAPATVSTDQTTTISSTSGQKVELSDITQVAIADKDLGEINFDDGKSFPASDVHYRRGCDVTGD
jgi:hypothetical protein